MDNSKEDSLSVPPELLEWGKFISNNNLLDVIPNFPKCCQHLSSIIPQHDYTLTDIKQQIKDALNDNKFSDWNITYDKNNVEWTAEYEDTNRTNIYNTGPFRLTVLISLYRDRQTNKYIIQVRAIQRSGELETNITRQFEEHLTHIFSVVETQPK